MTHPELRGHLIATGRGSRELIVGTDRDDTSDAVDRRVEFKVIQCLRCGFYREPLQ